MKLIINAGVKRLYLALDPDAADETQRLVAQFNPFVELFEMRASGPGTKPDLGAMSYEDVFELFEAAPRIEAGRVFIFLKPTR